MGELAAEDYRQDCNCSQCVLRAVEKNYQFNLPEEALCLCQGVGHGFGIGGICSGIVAGIMAFGLFFDESTVKRLRIKLLNVFFERYGSIQCGELENAGKCDEMIEDMAEQIIGFIDEELQCRRSWFS